MQLDLLTKEYAAKYEANAKQGIFPGVAKRAEEMGGFDKLAARAISEIRDDFEKGHRYDWLTHNHITLKPVVKSLFGFNTTKEWREAWTNN